MVAQDEEDRLCSRKRQGMGRRGTRRGQFQHGQEVDPVLGKGEGAARMYVSSPPSRKSQCLRLEEGAQQLYPVQVPFLASFLSLFSETRYEWSWYLSPLLSWRAITQRGSLEMPCGKSHPLSQPSTSPVNVASGHSTAPAALKRSVGPTGRGTTTPSTCSPRQHAPGTCQLRAPSVADLCRLPSK